MEDLIGKEFKTIAAAKNFIMKTNIYSSKMGSENYVGRNKADGMGGGGFTDEDGIHNMFMNISTGMFMSQISYSLKEDKNTRQAMD